MQRSPVTREADPVLQARYISLMRRLFRRHQLIFIDESAVVRVCPLPAVRICVRLNGSINGKCLVAELTHVPQEVGLEPEWCAQQVERMP